MKNNTFIIIIVIVAIAVVLWYVLHKRTVPQASTPVATTMPSAPGVNPYTGETSTSATNAPPSVSSTLVKVASNLNVTGALEHVPIVGGTAAAATRAPVKLAFAATKAASNVLSHVPIAGKPAAAVVNSVSNAGKSIAHVFGF
jgi:hypothetical protein